MSASPLPGVPAAHLAAFRAVLARLGVDGAVVPRSDEYLGEYVPPSGERLAWLTGFTGSAGTAAVLPGRAALFADGRYTTQAERQTDAALWERRHLTEQPPAAWLAEHAAGLRVGYDPWTLSEAALERLASKAKGATFVPLDENPVDAAWGPSRPAPPDAPAVPHPVALAGRESREKRADAAAALRDAGEDAAVLADPHSVAWLLNIRGGDLAHTPLVLARAVLRADEAGSVDLFVEPSKATKAVRAHLGNGVAVRPPGEFVAALDALAGKRVRVDAEATPAAAAARLRAAGAEVVAGEDPCRLPRARKTPAEREGARAAHRRDAAALARFLAWFAREAPRGGLTETSVADRLLAFRREGGGERFAGEAFPAIVGAGENGAIVHYRATPETDRRVAPGEAVLVDSGAQYADGTTDVTRTLWVGGAGEPSAELRDRYTRVLRGHIALAVTRFPRGVAGPHLDAVARRPLWAEGLDYDHGTGHGVGSFLSVHEGPAAFSRAARPVPLEEGMILSDEPGFYAPGRYGIRIENLLLVAAAGEGASGRPWFAFETLTLAPYERALVDPAMLTAEERAWVDAYHARVLAEVGPGVDEDTRAWLRAACAAL